MTTWASLSQETKDEIQEYDRLARAMARDFHILLENHNELWTKYQQLNVAGKLFDLDGGEIIPKTDGLQGSSTHTQAQLVAVSNWMSPTTGLPANVANDWPAKEGAMIRAGGTINIS